MSELVAMGASAVCTMGTAPAPVKVQSQSVVLADGKPAATIQDCQGGANIGPFGLCNSLQNPTVQAATAAKLGTLTPMPCMPVPAGAWVPTKPKVLVNGKPCLTSDCKLTCAYAGTVSITYPGQIKAMAT